MTVDTIAHGGVLLAVHRSIPARQLKLRTSLQAVAASIVIDRRAITICSIYLPPGVSVSRRELTQLVSELPEPLLMLGDFNAHHSLWGCENIDVRGRVLERIIQDEQLGILNTGTRTHFTMPSGSTSALDLSLVSPQLMPLFTWHVADDPLGSDHFPVWLNLNRSINLGTRPQRWCIRKADWDEFSLYLEEVFTSKLSENPDLSVDDFTTALLDAAGRFIPRISGAPLRAPVPWWNEECRAALRARRRAFKVFDKHATTENMIAFKKARAAARRIILEAKRRSWKEYISLLNRFTPVSRVWAQVKRISGVHSSPPLPVLEVRGQTVMQPADVAREIASAFAERCGSNSYDPAFLRHKRRCEAESVDFSTSEQLSYNRPFSMVELRSALARLRSVSEGPDQVHNDMLLHIPDVALETLLRIFNRLWERGDFPDAWREAIVVPLLKPGKSGTDPLHYRPISLTSSVCKLMERMVNARLSWFLEVNNILTESQCGFRRHRSTVDHLITLDTVIRTAFKQRRHVGAVFFDVEGAYDTTWRHGILLKVFSHGIRGAMGTFLQNFLHDRYFRVRIGNHLSDRFLQENGVPQGGVLSVALFAIMINDVVDVLPHSIGRSLFVDDFAIWCTSLSRSALERQLQLAVTRLERWASLNGLKFSTTKTKAMHFCRRRGDCSGVPLRLNRVTIPLEKSVRFLGLTMDSRLTYKEHLNALKKKCIAALNVLKCVSRTSYGSDRDTLLLLYRSLIRSKLDYASVVYDSACISNKRTLDTVHNAALRTAIGAFRTSPTSSILAEAHEPSLAMRRRLLSLRYAIKLRQFPSHPTYNQVFGRHVLAVFRGGVPLRSVPFCIRARELLLEAGVRLRGVARATSPRIPPWELAVPTIDVSISELKKKYTTVAELHSRALERISFYRNHTHFYTDGSKTDEGVGSAFVSGLVTRSFTLPPHASVFTSELIAILKALHFIEVSEAVFYVVFSDSLSSLLRLSHLNTFHPVLQSILVALTSLDRAGKRVVFCWLPSHVGVTGNERADEAAKRAARAACTRFYPLPAEDFLALCSAYIYNKWQEEWHSIGSSKLKLLKPQLARWRSSSRRARDEEVKLCRLRIGHTFATHRYLLFGEPRPSCSRCGEPLSVLHVLVSCRNLVSARTRFFGSNSFTLEELIGDGSPFIGNVLRFLAYIKFSVVYSTSP